MKIEIVGRSEEIVQKEIPGSLPNFAHPKTSLILFSLMTVVRQKEHRELTNIFENLRKKHTIVLLITPGFLDSTAVLSVTARPLNPAASLPELAVYMASSVLTN